MSPVAKWVLVAVLAAVASGYFGVMVWRAGSFARVLLRGAYAQRGISEDGMTLRVRVMASAGLALSGAGLIAAVVRIIG